MNQEQSLRIRPMTAGDLDEIMHIEQTIYPFPWSRRNFTDSLKAGYDAWRFFGANGTALGYSVLMWAPDVVHLLNLSIVQTQQGRGLGERCLRWLAENIRGRGATALILEVRPSNPRAIRLYERVGMKQIGLRTGYYPYFDGQREDAIVMHGHLPLLAALLAQQTQAPGLSHVE